MPHYSLPHRLSRALLPGFILIAATSAAIGEIAVDARTPGTDTSRLLYGSVVFWTRQGGGMLQTENYAAKQPVAFNQMALDRARDLKLSILRFGGCEMEVYNWRDGVGPNRPKRYQSLAKDQVVANEVGTGEFLDFCAAIGAEPLILCASRATRDWNDDTAPSGEQLAANWVEYCNGASPGLVYGRSQGWQPTAWAGTDPYKVEVKVPGSYLSTEIAPNGYFAWLREFFGRAQPYGVKYWEIGNELYLFGPNRPANKAWASPMAYAANFPKFSDAMKAKDPTVWVGALAWTHNLLTPNLNYSEGYYWNSNAFGFAPTYTPALQKADFLTLHEYIGPNVANPASPETEYAELFQAPVDLEARLVKFKSFYNKPIIVTEYNVQYGVFSGADPKWIPHQHRLKSGLVIATMQNVFHRQGIYAACEFHLLDVGLWFQTDVFRMAFDDVESGTLRRRTGVTPSFLALKLFSEYSRGKLLPTTVSLQKNLDVIAVRAEPGGQLRLFVINKSSATDEPASISISGFTPAGGGTAYTMNSPQGLEAFNEGSAAQVTTTTKTLTGVAAKYPYTFPAHSLTVLDITPKPAAGALAVRSYTSATAPKPRDVITYTTECVNNGTSAIPSAEVKFNIPSGTDYVAGSANPSGVYSSKDVCVTWTATSIQPAETRLFRCDVKVR